MTDRWIAVLAAVLALIGGLGGAAVGGYVANQGQAQRLEHEQATQIRDLRINTYVKFLRAAQTEHDHRPTVDRLLHTAEAEVALVAPNNQVRDAATALSNYASSNDRNAGYIRLRNRFIHRAQTVLYTGE
jgi:type II secretory pathway pseudopilin PulG